MNKQLTYYEFVGVLVPSVILLYFSEIILSPAFDIELFDLAEIGESLVFLIVAYGIGHILHALGNIFESIIWWSVNGKPTNWITKPQRFFRDLFDESDQQRILDKIKEDYSLVDNKDYGMLIYCKLHSLGKHERIDIFNGNYSLYRSLCVVFILLLIESSIVGMWLWSIVILVVLLLCHLRMIRFAKHYAKELYRSYLNL